MNGFRMILRKSLFWVPIFLSAGGLFAQTCMVLSYPTIGPDGTASLDLSIYSPKDSGLAGVQWTFQYPASSITTLTVDDGPVLTSARKTAICAGDSTAYNCLTTGANSEIIANGVMVKLTAVLASGATMPPIVIKSALGASLTGYVIPITAKVATKPGTDASADCGAQAQKQASAGK